MSLGYEKAKIKVDGEFIATIVVEGDNVTYTTDTTGAEFSAGDLVEKLPKLREAYPEKEFSVVGE